VMAQTAACMFADFKKKTEGIGREVYACHRND
jgi:hypothetical protein